MSVKWIVCGAMAAMVVGSVSAANGAVVLIDSQTRNGSFETGTTTSWAAGTGLGISVSSAASPGASDGTYYLVGTEASTADKSTVEGRADSRNIAVDLSAGNSFSLSLDARAAASDGFTQLIVATYFPVDGTSPAVINQSLSTTWEHFSTTFSAPANSTKFDIRIAFRKTNSTNGTAYTAYLDNVQLTQVPEPAVAGLVLPALIGVLARRRRRRIA
jgi:hypothetical protein